MRLQYYQTQIGTFTFPVSMRTSVTYL